MIENHKKNMVQLFVGTNTLYYATYRRRLDTQKELKQMLDEVAF